MTPTATPRRLKASPKARKMWSISTKTGVTRLYKDKGIACGYSSVYGDNSAPIPVYVLPGDDESVEAMEDALSQRLAHLRNGATWPISARDIAKIAMEVFGIRRKRSRR